MNTRQLITRSSGLAILAITSLLAGCGGSSSSITGLITRWPNITPPGTVTLNDGITTDITFDENANVVSSNTSTGATVTLSYDATGTLDAISASTHGDTISLSTAAGDIYTRVSDVGTFVSADQSQVIAFNIPQTATYNWDYQTYGTWMDAPAGGNFTLGMFSVGLPTAGNAIPINGTANFTGLSEGAYLDSENVYYYTQANVNISADFAGHTLQFGTSGTQKTELGTLVTTPASNLDMSGKLEYVAGTNAITGTVQNPVMSGTATAQFYGPNAEEIGGVYSMSGSGSRMIGAFGAKR